MKKAFNKGKLVQFLFCFSNSLKNIPLGQKLQDPPGRFPPLFLKKRNQIANSFYPGQGDFTRGVLEMG
jgi:hypothetical protein